MVAYIFLGISYGSIFRDQHLAFEHTYTYIYIYVRIDIHINIYRGIYIYIYTCNQMETQT